MKIPCMQSVDRPDNLISHTHKSQFQATLSTEKCRRKKYISKNLRKEKKGQNKNRRKKNQIPKSQAPTNHHMILNASSSSVEGSMGRESWNPKENENPMEMIFNSNSLSQENMDPVYDYSGQIQISIYQREQKYVPSPLQDQTDVSIYNRTQLIKWLFVACEKFNFQQDTAFLSVNILDRILGLTYIQTHFLHLLAITSLFVAAKYEEIAIPKISDFVFLGKGNTKINKQSILNFEAMILTLLEFDLSYVSPIHFINRTLPEQQKHAIIERVKLLLPELKYRCFSSSQIVEEVCSLAQQGNITLSKGC